MNSPHPAELRSASEVCQQMLVFNVGEAIYGVDILEVQEIRGWSSVTRIPHSPPDVLGVIHLRGSVVPIVDLRIRFSFGRVEYNSKTVIIVLAAKSTAGRIETGFVVDGVEEVVDVDASRLRPAPDLGARQTTEYVSGLLPLGERMVVLLDVDRLVGPRTTRLRRAA